MEIFLDLTIKIHDGKNSTDLFRKQTDKPTALLPSSAHPGHITNNIVYSMAFRILRICSEQENFEKRLDELKNEFLIPRNYKAKLIDEQFSRIKNLPGIDFKEKRKEALKKVKKQTKQSNRIIAPLDFNPHLPIPSKILQKHHRALLASAPHLAQIFPEPPMPAYRQPPNLRNLLCKSKLYPAKRAQKFKRSTHKEAPGWKKCAKPCKICPYTLENTNTVIGTSSNFKHVIKEAVSCDTSNCVYYWKCIKQNCQNYPECEYIGKTKRQFKDRLAEHRDYPKRDVVSEPSGHHFTQPGHDVSHLRGLVLEHVRNKDPYVLKSREHYYIQKFDTFRRGLNQEK